MVVKTAYIKWLGTFFSPTDWIVLCNICYILVSHQNDKRFWFPFRYILRLSKG